MQILVDSSFDHIAALFLIVFSLTVDITSAVSHVAKTQPTPRVKRAYDMDAALFSPDGSLYQVEYAIKSVQQGSLSIGMVCADGVILLAYSAKQSDLLVKESVRKIFKLDQSLACTLSGLQSDGRLLIRQARAYLANHDRIYGEIPSLESIVGHLSDVYLLFNDYPVEENEERKRHARPLGAGMLIASFEDEPSLFFLNPAGTQGSWKAKSMGKYSDSVDKLLQKVLLKKKELTLTEGLMESIKILKEVLGTEFLLDNVEAFIILRDNVRQMNITELRELVEKKKITS